MNQPDSKSTKGHFILSKKRSNVEKQNSLIRPALLLFLFFLLYSIILSITSASISRKTFKSNTELLSDVFLDVLTPFTELADEQYLKNFDVPLEDLFHTTDLISYAFSTTQYPPTDQLIARVRSVLTESSGNSAAAVSTFLYSSTLDTILSDPTASFVDGRTEMADFYNTLIYSYNSNTIEKYQIPNRDHNTFLFHYQDYLVLSKDLTTYSGQSHTSIFLLLDPITLVNELYAITPSIQRYHIGVYDPNGIPVYTTQDTEVLTAAQLLAIAGQEEPSDFSQNNYHFYTKSEILQWQYVLSVDHNQIYERENNTFSSILYVLLASLLLSLVTTVILIQCFGKAFTRITKQLQLPSDHVNPHILSDMENKIQSLISSNVTLQEILSATPAEAVYSLFSLLILGKKVDEERIGLTLNNTEYGFRPDDIYVAGILQHTKSRYLDTETRYRILNLTNVTFDRFKEKHPCNVFVFSCDANRFAVIVSFGSDVSIAKGKSRVNRLSSYLQESFQFAGIPLTIAFGHMYNSILDLYFSYNEAVNIISLGSTVEYEQEHDISPSSDPNVRQNDDLAKDQVPQILSSAETSVSLEVSKETEKKDTSNRIFPSPSDPFDTEIPDSVDAGAEAEDEKSIDDNNEVNTLELIERRAAQIADMIYQDKQDEASDLVSRIIQTIFQNPQDNMVEINCKRLVSTLTDNIISYEYVNASDLSDVYKDLVEKINQSTPRDELEEALKAAILKLCEDFSAVLEKQRNPYVQATMTYIADNYSNPDLSLKDIAEALKIAPNYLSTVFSRCLGKKLFEYVNEYRLERSIEMLLTTDKMIADISEENGFGSSRNYIRIFRKYKDTTPGNYRKQHLNKLAPGKGSRSNPVIKELTDAARKASEPTDKDS